MLAVVNCSRSITKKLERLVTMVVALFFAEHRLATNSPIIISSTVLSLNSLTLNYLGLLISFSVSSIHITWMLENALFISQLCKSSSSSSNSSSSSRAAYYNKSIHQTFASSMILLSSFRLRFDAILSYSLFKPYTKTVWYEVRYTANQGLLS